MHKYTFPPRLREKKGPSLSFLLWSHLFSAFRSRPKETEGKGLLRRLLSAERERERKFFFSGTASFLRCCNFVGCLPAPEWCGGQRTRRTVWRLLLAPPLPPSLLSLYYRRLLLLLSLSQEKTGGGSLPPFSPADEKIFFREIAGRKRGNECVCAKEGGRRGDPAAVSGAKVLQARPIAPIHLPSFLFSRLLPTFGGGKEEV